MFSRQEKQMISRVIEDLLLGLNHPEMPDKRPDFQLQVNGEHHWSWAEIDPNWKYEDEEPITSEWNENVREILKKEERENECKED